MIACFRLAQPVPSRALFGILFLGLAFVPMACDGSGDTSTANETGLVPTEGDTGGADVCEGIEVDLQNDKNNCGACGVQCAGAAADNPDFDLDTQACVAGQCQVAWNFCSDLTVFAGQSCAELCPHGCAQDGCGGETLVVRRDVNTIGVQNACEHDSAIMEVQSGYACADALPASTASGTFIDTFSCCCEPG